MPIIPEIEPPKNGSSINWSNYYLTAIVIVVIGVFVYQETWLSSIEAMMSSIQATLEARQAIFAALAADDAKIINNQDDIRRRMEDHELTAFDRYVRAFV